MQGSLASAGSVFSAWQSDISLSHFGVLVVRGRGVPDTFYWRQRPLIASLMGSDSSEPVLSADGGVYSGGDGK